MTRDELVDAIAVAIEQDGEQDERDDRELAALVLRQIDELGGRVVPPRVWVEEEIA